MRFSITNLSFFFSAAFFFGLLGACKKGQSDLNVTIQLTNASHGIALDGATVTIKKVMSGTSDILSIGSFNSNALGQVKFSTKRDKFDYLTIQLEKANYFGSEHKIYLSDLTTNNDNVINYNLLGKAWAGVRLKTTSSNSVNVQKNGGKSGCPECCSSSMQFFQGPIDTTFYCINNANTVYSYIYIINGGSSGEKSAITLFADTTEILLEF